MSKIQVAYNNVEGDTRLKKGRGLSALIEHDGELILFDVGPSAEELFFNLDILGVDRKKINKVVISHIHPDHKGALDRVLEKISSNAGLFLPGTVKGKKKISNHIYIYTIKRFNLLENILVIDSSQGLIILIGCAHPGMYRIARTIKDDFGKNIYAALGGFHFEHYPSLFVKILGHLLKRLGIKIIGPNHCTGERAIKVLRQIFKDGFLDFGCGKIFHFF